MVDEVGADVSSIGGIGADVVNGGDVGVKCVHEFVGCADAMALFEEVFDGKGGHSDRLL